MCARTCGPTFLAATLFVFGLGSPAAFGQPCDLRWGGQAGLPGLPDTVSVLGVYDDGNGPILYAGGHFDGHLSRWDGQTWLDVGWIPGSGHVWALTTFDDGSGLALYAGGRFTLIGGVPANYIAKFDGNQWSPLGSGLGSVTWPFVSALAVFDDGNGPALYAAGRFAHAGGVSVNGIAKWDGQQWYDVGGGVNQDVFELVVFDDGSGPALYIGGAFTEAGGQPINRIAKWDGNSWSPLGSGANDAVFALAVFDGVSGPALYAGGIFTEAGGAAAPSIATWDGQSWSDIDGGMDDWVYTLNTFDDGSGLALYAGGDFMEAGQVSANHIAKWNGQSWSPLGGGTDGGGGTNELVRALSVFDDGLGDGPALYVGGEFTEAGDLPANYVARWGCAQSPQACCFYDSSCTDLPELDCVLQDGQPQGPGTDCATGQCTRPEACCFGDGSCADLHASDCADQEGSPQGPSTECSTHNCAQVEACCFGNGACCDLAAPYCSAEGGKTQGPGTTCQTADCPSASVEACCFADGGCSDLPQTVCAGQGGRPQGLDTDCTTADCLQPPECELDWDETIGSGVANDNVYALTELHDGLTSTLYAGGRFTVIGGGLASHIARWDGEVWSAVGGGFDRIVYDLTVFDDGTGPALYACGRFTMAGGQSANRVAKWDGTSWSPVGAGFDMTTWALVVFDDGAGPALYAGGENVAKWIGSEWLNVGGVMTEAVIDLVVFDDGCGSALYAGGYFGSAGGTNIVAIAKWDGLEWSALGSGLAPAGWAHVRAMAVFDDGLGPALYAGGEFDEAGGNSAKNIAKWDGGSWSPLGDGVYPPDLRALAVFDDGAGPALYAGGEFYTAGDVSAWGIAKWDGLQWSAFGELSQGPGSVGYCYALAPYDDGTGPSLFVGGRFTEVDGVSANSVARWGCADCPWDLDGDGIVGPADLAQVLGAWGPCEGCPTDFNGDGMVNAADLAQLLGAWGICP